MRHFATPQEALQYHVSGAIARGEKEAIMEQPITFTLADHYDRRKQPRTATFRALTREEGLALTFGKSLKCQSMDGARAIDVRQSGKVRTWKRDPNRIEIPCKFGMYESATFTYGARGFESSGGARLVVQVSDWSE